MTPSNRLNDDLKPEHPHKKKKKKKKKKNTNHDGPDQD